MNGSDSMGLKKPLSNFLIALVTFVLAFGLAELIVIQSDVLGGIGLVTLMQDEFRIHFMNPGVVNGMMPCVNATGWPDSPLIAGCTTQYTGIDVRIPKSTVSINSFGLRDKEYSLLKPSNTVRIFVLGDSTTSGEGVDNGNAYPNIVEQKLNLLRTSTSFEVFNLGFSGGSTDSEYVRLLQYLNYSPDIVVLQTLDNDLFECGSFYEEAKIELNDLHPYPDEKHIQGPKYIKQLPPEKVCSCTRAAMQNLIQLTSAADIPLLIYDMTSQSHDLRCFRGFQGNQTYYKKQIVPKREHFLSRKDAHFNKKGHEAAAAVLLPNLVEIIKKDLGIDFEFSP